MIISGCPCGSPHECAAEAWAAFKRVTQGLSEDVPVITWQGTYVVPRIYIALHGISTTDLPGLAARYGWPRVEESHADNAG